MLFKKYFITKSVMLLSLLLTLNLPVFSAQQDIQKLNSIEYRLFNRNYSDEKLNDRLNRVEKEIFGKTFQEPANNRLNRLNSLNCRTDSYAPAQENVSPESPVMNYSASDNSAIEYPTVSRIEEKVFGKNFKNENIYSRINRLESKLFGTTFPNADLSGRVDKLKIMTNIEDNKYSRDSELPGNYRSSDDPDSVYDNLSYLESRIFGRTFNNDGVTERIERIENRIFGSVQRGMIKNRLNRLNNSLSLNNQQNNPNIVSQQSLIMQNDNFFNSNSSFFNSNDGFFNDSQQMSQQRAGLLDYIGAALPFVLSFLNRNNTPDPVPSANYYNYPPYSYYPYNYQGNYPYFPPNYCFPYNRNQANNSAYIYSPLGPSIYTNHSAIHTGMGTGVRILRD